MHQNLLSQASHINKQYQKITALSGENFNIFDILKLSTREVRTHSAFLGELLNPNGSHGQKGIFLQLFCEQILNHDFDCERANVYIEKYTGFISEDGNHGGNIDIMVTDGTRSIIIENKIYAGDQQNQLLRYHNYGKKTGQPFDLLYLTLDGKNATEWSKQSLHESEIKNISYANEIILWLESCREKTTEHPIVRETITQYIHLIKKLTGQTMNEQMKKEIVDLLTANGSNMSASIEIANAVDTAKKKLLKKLAQQLGDKMANLIPDIKIEIAGNFGTQFQGINFRLPNLDKEYIMLSFLSNMRDIYLEVVNLNNEDNHTKKNIANIKYYERELEWTRNNWGKLENMYTGWNGDWVCRYTKLETQLNWSDLADGNFDDLVNEIALDMVKLIDVLKKKEQETIVY